MKAVRGFQRQGSFPTQDRALGQSISLLEQRTADGFDALSKSSGDVVGDWIALQGLGLDGSTLGNGRITGKWRLVGSGNAGFRLSIEVGTTTTFGAFGFALRPPPGYVFDTSQALFPLSGNAVFPVTLAGRVGILTTGSVNVALMTTAGVVLILGAGIAALGSGDQVTLEVELPVKVAR